MGMRNESRLGAFWRMFRAGTHRRVALLEGQRKSNAESSIDDGRLRGGLYSWLPADIQGAVFTAHAFDVHDQRHFCSYDTGCADSLFSGDVGGRKSAGFACVDYGNL